MRRLIDEGDDRRAEVLIADNDWNKCSPSKDQTARDIEKVHAFYSSPGNNSFDEGGSSDHDDETSGDADDEEGEGSVDAVSDTED
ncbi:hypothetical protein EJB05_30908 [Eragrostis curvula]|uniref:Uncharacterized protein n=1 Tax=Eragrostis curvula TaxID=38414 RepID=A0A5J9UDE4_9POAL|nr:hypothetical protein EJB05_30908 [Eragrostis curvula]